MSRCPTIIEQVSRTGSILGRESRSGTLIRKGTRSSTIDEKESQPSTIDEKESSVDKDVEASPTDNDPEPTTTWGILKRWPLSTFCIVGNEFCERFSFVGMRTVLTLYVMNILAFSDDNATILFHSFIVLCYTTPLLGSIIADSYIGKFWTILWISLVYAAGNVILAVASTFSKSDNVHPYLDIIGLVVIGIGTGGIKPCVAAFAGDQFNPNHHHMISIFFSVFYFTVNAGSMISSLITPIMRTVPCNGMDSCYPMAFGIPAGLMVLATIIFISGSIFYNKLPPKENIFARVCVTVVTALKNKIVYKTSRPHWLEHYFDNHNCDEDPHCIALRKESKEGSTKCAEKRFVDDVKTIISVIIIFMPVPFFWALYDQQGSRWIIQAVAMDSRVSDSFSILPDQVITINSILVLLFIPIFQTLVYPAFEKCGIRTTPLRRLVVGGFLGALSFVICGLVQLKVNQTLPEIPGPHHSTLSIINTYTNCDLNVTSPGLPDKFIARNSSLIDNRLTDVWQMYQLEVDGGSKDVQFNFAFAGECGMNSTSYTATVQGGKTFYVIVTPQGIAQGEGSLQKPTEGSGQSSMNINFMIPCSMVPESVKWGNCASKSNKIAYNDRIAVCAVNSRSHPCNPRSSEYYGWAPNEGQKQIAKSADGSAEFVATNYAFKDVRPQKYQAYYVYYNRTVDGGVPAAEDVTAVPIEGFTFEFNTMGGVYTFTFGVQNDSGKMVNSLYKTHHQEDTNHMNSSFAYCASHPNLQHKKKNKSGSGISFLEKVAF
uniref:Oligopeptide transporter 1 n=1 Tax=Anisakis simplex TaxID=6269 RepID=A0A3G6JBL3_ANISI|nr:peptide transporter family 1 [Anisakis simplex]